MRKILATLLVLGIVWVGYTAWPLYDLFVLLRAISARYRHRDAACVFRPYPCLAYEQSSLFAARAGWSARRGKYPPLSVAEPVVKAGFRRKRYPIC
jgi:hypothetical protein